MAARTGKISPFNSRDPVLAHQQFPSTRPALFVTHTQITSRVCSGFPLLLHAVSATLAELFLSPFLTPAQRFSVSVVIALVYYVRMFIPLLSVMSAVIFSFMVDTTYDGPHVSWHVPYGSQSIASEQGIIFLPKIMGISLLSEKAHIVNMNIYFYVHLYIDHCEYGGSRSPAIKYATIEPYLRNHVQSLGPHMTFHFVDCIRLSDQGQYFENCYTFSYNMCLLLLHEE
ncbi:hypothetical protein M378DRAFT_182292 [Amanita muscaria Koide BX008]|uniref:Uncharacterized protein n=1 Tax=Amanita muscaria (strain Koide BX008) TaxID=946122 RepID=A0A0C2WGF8_AMAMK|nr:hypothetical protein M378DRAFT_182292 [Amanita muscaria Koide BX008]